MIWFALAVAAAAPSGPAKLIVMPPNQPAMSVDYPTMERCQRARAELLRQASADTISAEDATALERRLGRPVIVQHVSAYCIPG